MIEEIKKEISNLTTFNGGHNRMYISDLFKILDKYKDKEKVKYIFTCKDCEEWYGVCPHSYREYDLEKYKNAWEELKKYQTDLDKTNMDTLVRDNSEFYHYQRGNMMGHKNIGLKIQELEKNTK